MNPLRLLGCLTALLLTGVAARGDASTDKLAALVPGTVQLLSVPVDHWRFHQPDLAGGERIDFDDSAWPVVAPGYSWSGENTKVWFRATVTLPDRVAGQSVEGLPVRLDVGMDDDGELYVDGQLKEAFHWDEGHYTLTEHAHAGQTFHLAVRGINGPGSGQLHFARLYFNALPELGRYLDAAKFVELLAGQVAGDERATLAADLYASEAEIHFDNLTSTNLATVRAQLTAAQAALAPAATFTRKYDVYYVGHAHIDMNWLWPWSETIDVCQRTWNSAMNLMDEFPQFRFVQSQPGAYVPIEAQFPAEFARMQAMAARGQWEPVGGLWNESDTDLPGGEGLAQSIALGQRYFKAKFGKYAVTGWLPDSFGHTWQLPQIMRQAGIRYFYHTRCGNTQGITWWEAPDGSRVLKVNTADYDEDVKLEQLAVPAVNEQRLNLPQSLVVFGVGDHGGGPTREHLLRIQSFQDNPILPRVHFAGADDYFAQLERQPAAAALPVVDTDLQYTFEGCYTSHGDIKKALRSHENNLYTAQVLASLAALRGRSYPVAEFDEAWKPVSFAQFHDIACGTAMHATYDWMHEQLAPAFRFETNQIDACLDFLTAQADTRGPGGPALVVWNTLSFARDDVVRVPLDGAGQFHSVVDQDGHRFPAQATSGSLLVFVARNVPAFGHAVYFPATNTCPADGITLRDNGETYAVETPSLSFQIDKAGGAMTQLLSKPAAWDVFGPAAGGNVWQLLSDMGNAWDIKYTGTNRTLAVEGASVQLLDDGPVFTRLRVTHALGRSTYTQDLVAYGALPRIDVPTTVDWQEEHTTLKVRFPLNATNLDAQAEIPFGSIGRPVSGQECPGQRWMDVSEDAPATVLAATPLDLSACFNARAAENFDGEGNAYAADLLPAAGRYRLGQEQVTFDLPGSASNRLDSITAAGQRIPLPAAVEGDTVYLLAACVNRGRWTDLGFQLADGAVQSRAFQISDWVVNDAPDNQAGFTFAYRQSAAGKQTGVPSHWWVIGVPRPKGATSLILPRDGEVRVFAATLATRPARTARFGLSILNDCKYGFDVTNNVFRLTALRSATEPDPHPDQGLQSFTYSLYPHAGGWREARSDRQALALNLPLLARVTMPHAPAGELPTLSLTNVGGAGNVVVSALKHSEDGSGYVLRFYETDGADTQARIQFDRDMQVQETDLLEQPVTNHVLSVERNAVSLPVGHNQIISLRLEPVVR
jgi:alpha-mannosidase